MVNKVRIALPGDGVYLVYYVYFVDQKTRLTSVQQAI
jgi:hypothetical protein